MVETSQHGAPDSAPVLLTFLIADVRGYTSFTVERGNDAAARLALTFAAVAEEVIAVRGGEVIELRGDEALAVFTSPRQALFAAVDLQHRFVEHTEIDPTLPLRVGIGIDSGEAVPVKGGYRGLALNLAARLCSLAGPGEVYGSENVVQLAQRLEGLAYVERGRVQLKGFADPIRIIQIVAEDEVLGEFSPLVSLVAKPSNLPLQPTPFIGREQETAGIIHMLKREEVRLLTLVGPGGTGKTRLALQVGGAMLNTFEDGVFFVSLSPVTNSVLIASTIAGTLKVKERSDAPLLDTLEEYLSDKQMLLVLDNFEHLLDGAPVVSDLLAASPNLKVLVTSQAVLRLSGEHDYLVPPLRVPDPKHLPGLETLSQYEGVALFIERARAVTPTFVLTNENAQAIAEICYRLDGLPLAIELAAARTRLLPPEALLMRLSSRLKILTGGVRDAPGRHQTLRATIDWSCSLLSEGEKRLLARLSVFHGGCTLEAAEAICASDEILDLEVLDGLGSLVEKSLLRREGEEDSRFLMLQTIGEYARERLEASGEAEQVRTQHAQYYLRLTEAVEPEMRAGGQVEWLERLERDHDNLRTALGWLLKRGDVEGELRMAGALQWFWSQRCHFTEGRRWIEAGLAQSGDISVGVRMKALQAAARLAMIQGDQTHAIAASEELLNLSTAHHDPTQRSSALTTLGMTAVQRGDHLQAADYLEEALSIVRAQGSRVDLAHPLYNLGLARSEAGRYSGAIALVEEALTLFRDKGDLFWAMNAGGSLGYIALLEGRHEQARGLLVEYLRTALRLGDKANIAAGLEGLAVAAAEEGRAEHAIRLFAAAESLRQEIGGRLMSLRNRTMIEDSVGSTHEQLGEEAWQMAWEEGQAMTMEQAASMAMQEERNRGVAE